MKSQLNRLSQELYLYLSTKTKAMIDLNNLDPDEWNSEISDKKPKMIIVSWPGNNDWLKNLSYNTQDSEESEPFKNFFKPVTFELRDNEGRAWNRLAEKIDRILSYKKAIIDSKIIANLEFNLN